MKNYTMMYKHISNYIKQINQTVNSFVIPLGLFFGTPPSPPPIQTYIHTYIYTYVHYTTYHIYTVLHTLHTYIYTHIHTYKENRNSMNKNIPTRLD